MRHRAVAAQVEIPPVSLWVESLFFHSRFEHVEPLFALAAADDLAYAGHQHIHRAHGLSVVVDAHVKRFDGPRVIEEDHRSLENLFGQITLVLGLQVLAPSDRELKTFAGFFQPLDRLGVG